MILGKKSNFRKTGQTKKTPSFNYVLMILRDKSQSGGKSQDSEKKMETGF